MEHNQDASIGTLRVRGGVRDQPTLRLAVSGFIGRADLQPRGLPPTAVLIVRRLRDPMPGSVPNALGQRLRHAAWERAVRDQLDDMSRAAVRPYQGVMPPPGEAVMFGDRAEMLACLSLDLVNGSAGQHWWWRTLLRYPGTDLTPVRQLMAVWQQDINLLPAVLGSLYAWGRVEEVLNKLNADEARELSRALAKVFELSVLTAALETVRLPGHDALINTVLDDDHPEVGATRAPDASPQGHNSAYIYRIVPVNQVAAVWQRLLPNTRLPLQLGRELSHLLGLGLALQRAPWRCRDTKVQAALAAAWRGVERVPLRPGVSAPINVASPGQGLVETEVTAPEQHPPSLPIKQGQSGQDSESAHSTMTETPAGETAQGVMTVDGQDDVPPDGQPASAPGRARSSPSTQGLAQDIVAGKSSSTQDTGQAEAVMAANALKDQTIANDADVLIEHTIASDAQPLLSDEGVTTDLGGVLYLINLMQRLDLPACFENEWHLQSQLSPWALLELLARGLLLQGDSVFPEDPLWQVLAQLDGRAPGDPIGEGFVGADTYQIPWAWLQQIDLHAFDIAYADEEKNLRVWSTTASFLIAEQARQAGQGARQQALSLINDVDDLALASLTRRGFSSAPLFDVGDLSVEVTSTALLYWLRCVLPYITCVLAQQTGAQDGRFDTSLLRCRGRLFVTDTHIDLCTGLDNIALPMRRAGLDQDPGWLSEYGRVLLFHFD